MAAMRELPIPPDASGASQATEVARAWIIDKKLQCSLLPTIWAETPETWGILLADFAAHIADAISVKSDMTRDEIHRIIAKKLREELTLPTTEFTGDFVDWDNNR